uniref:flagellar basal body-associated protein FliL n=1 Tax=Polynucleobacter sp. TaxID=2029855 RepID=UPI004048DA5B
MAEKDIEKKDEEAPKKSKLPLIIIGAVVVLALAGGGAWFFLKGDSEEVDEKAEAKASAVESIPVYMPIDTLTVNLKDSRQYLQLTITLQLKNGEDSALVKLYMPQVRTRALIILASKKPEDVISSEGKLALLEELKTITAKPFTEKLEPIEILDVSFTSFIIQ